VKCLYHHSLAILIIADSLTPNHKTNHKKSIGYDVTPAFLTLAKVDFITQELQLGQSHGDAGETRVRAIAVSASTARCRLASLLFIPASFTTLLAQTMI